MKKFKQAKTLPNRGTMKRLTASGTIVDYAKSTPLGIGTPTPAAVQNLRKRTK